MKYHPRTLLAAALALSAFPTQADEIMRLAPGRAGRIELKENPSTGYRWRLDPEASDGLDILSISDDGHMRGENMPGAPGTHRWTVKALSPGDAEIQFVYQRSWEPAPLKTLRVEVEISR